MPRWVRLGTAVALVLALASCAMSRKIATRDELIQLPPAHPIVVYAQQDRVYLLQQHAVVDSSLRGSGTLTEHALASPFDGPIPFSQIIAIRTDSRSVLKALVVAGITAMFVAEIVDVTRSSAGLHPTVVKSVHIPPSSGLGSSCPYVYAWDGARYALQAEPFGTAWGKALEQTTRHLLPAARTENGVLRLRLTNEREETHYVNSIEVFRIDLGTASTAVLDGDGTAWPLSRPVPPVVAQDRSGRDILPLVVAADDRVWECAASSMTASSGYEDVLELAFARPPHVVAGSLVITGINTTLSSVVYGHMCRWVGDQTPALAHAVETDPQLIAELREYTRDASLAVSVWNGHRWVATGAFLPEANAVSFMRALRIGVPDGAGDTVRVRLRSMADVWRIDAISADWSDARPLPMTRVDLRSAIGPSGEDLRKALGADDDRYAILLPPDRVDLAFAATESKTGARVAYAVAARGYLMEWDPPAAEDGSTAPGSGLPADRRIAFLEELLKHRDLALGPVYEDWRKLRVR